MKMYKRGLQILSEGGPVELIRRGVPFLYNEFVWPRLPKREQFVRLGGVLVFDHNARLLDGFWRHLGYHHIGANRAQYEKPLIDGLREQVREGDEVVIVGGGYGVTTTVAAQETGESGSVTVFEASQEQINDVYITIGLNGVGTTVSVRHAIVGSAVSLYGDSGTAPTLGGDELPECDVLELDCEGAEAEILESLKLRPRTIIVETHECYDAPEEMIVEKLNELGYDVVRSRVVWAERGITVVVAVRSES